MRRYRQKTLKARVSFSERVKTIVRAIPLGKTLSYSEVARRACSPRACRAVGNILNKNYSPDVPCHRVIYSDGESGSYNRGVTLKKTLLMLEKRMIK